MAILVICVVPSKVVGCPLLIKRSSTKPDDIIKIKMKGKISFFIILILSSILFFAILTPKISIKIFPFLREKKLKEFKNYLLKTTEFNSQIFWQFREFYCPGYFIFKKEGLNIKNDLFFKEVKAFLKNTKNVIPWFARYHCSYLKSFEGLTEKEFLDDILNLKEIVNRSIIFKKTDEFVFFQEKKSKNYYIIFLLDQQKMKKAVGFFDYEEKDKELVKDKIWLDITKINNDGI